MCSLASPHDWLGAMCEARELDDNWDTERDGRSPARSRDLAGSDSDTEYWIWAIFQIWNKMTQPRWMTQTRNFDVYCKAAWRMIWRLRGYEVCQNYYPIFLSKVFLRAVPSLSLLQNASKKLKQNLVTSLTFDFNFIMFEQARHLYLTNYSSLLSFISSGFKVNVYISTTISWLL